MSDKDIDLLKKEAAAKAKAAALAKQKRTEEASDSSVSETEEEKTKALALAKAKAVAKAKAAAAAKAKLAAKTKQADSKEQKEVEKEILPNQEQLDKYVTIIKHLLGEESIDEYYINKLSKNIPTLVVQPKYYFKVAELLRNDDNLQFDYVIELHGTDFKTYMEVYVYLHSFAKDQSIVLKVKLDRNQLILPSLVPLWEGVNWPECETYDLLGIQFENHPDLKRILLGEDWVGYPLRKDYEPYDVEV